MLFCVFYCYSDTYTIINRSNIYIYRFLLHNHQIRRTIRHNTNKPTRIGIWSYHMKRHFMHVIDQNFIKWMGNFMCNVHSSLYKLHPLNVSGPESTRGQSRPCHGLRAPEVVRMCITLLHTCYIQHVQMYVHYCCF